MDMQRARRFAELKKRIDKLEEELGPLKDEYEQLADPDGAMMREFMQSGLQRLSVDGVTIYLHRQVWAKAVAGTDAACDALVASGDGVYVKPGYNHQSVSARVRELYGDGMDPDWQPPEWKGVIDAVEVYKLKAVRG